MSSKYGVCALKKKKQKISIGRIGFAQTFGDGEVVSNAGWNQSQPLTPSTTCPATVYLSTHLHSILYIRLLYGEKMMRCAGGVELFFSFSAELFPGYDRYIGVYEGAHAS